MESSSLHPIDIALIEEKVKILMILTKQSHESRNILELFHEEKRQLISQYCLQQAVIAITGVNNCKPCAHPPAGGQSFRESIIQHEYPMPYRRSFDGNRHRSSFSVDDEEKRSAYNHINKKNRREEDQQAVTTGEIRQSLYTDAKTTRDWDVTRKMSLYSCISTSTADQNSTEGGYDSSSSFNGHYVQNQHHEHSNRRGSFPNPNMPFEEDSEFDDHSMYDPPEEWQ